MTILKQRGMMTHVNTLAILCDFSCNVILIKLLCHRLQTTYDKDNGKQNDALCGDGLSDGSLLTYLPL